MKLAAKKAVKEAYKDKDNWDAMRQQLQKADVVKTNSKATPKRDWLTTDHIFVKQRHDLPHKITNHPANLQIDVPLGLNSKFEHMKWYQRAAHLPPWMKLGAAGITSYTTGLFYNADSSGSSSSSGTSINK